MDIKQLDNIKQPEKCKVAVIKESLVALTGGFIPAVILNQFLYWTERVKDFDKFIEEEKQRAENLGITGVDFPKSHGWIYKKASELSEETMLGLSENAIRGHINTLIEGGWLEKRKNPDPRYKFDKTFQYRVNITKIQLDLFKLGYVLDGYKFSLSPIELLRLSEKLALKEAVNQNTENESRNAINAISEARNSENEPREEITEDRNSATKVHNADPELPRHIKCGAIPETTTEINTKTTTEINTKTTTEINTKTTTWQKVLSELKRQLGPAYNNLDIWLSTINVSVSDNTLILVCPNQFAKDWIETRYADLIGHCIKVYMPEISQIIYRSQ